MEAVDLHVAVGDGVVVRGRWRHTGPVPRNAPPTRSVSWGSVIQVDDSLPDWYQRCRCAPARDEHVDNAGACCSCRNPRPLTSRVCRGRCFASSVARPHRATARQHLDIVRRLVGNEASRPGGDAGRHRRGGHPALVGRDVSAAGYRTGDTSSAASMPESVGVNPRLGTQR